MLSRALLPLARLRTVPVTRIAVAQPRIRLYAKSWNDRSRRDGDYKLPESAPRHPWQEESDLASESKHRNYKEPLRRVSQDPDEFINTEAAEGSEISQERQTVDPTDEAPRRPKPSSRDSRPFQEKRTSDAAEQPETVDDEPLRPLPDLTKGIPSTLEAELKQAQAKRGTSPSLNITEDPSEPVAGEDDGQGRERVPRSEYVSSSDQKKNTVFRFVYILMFLGVTGYTAYLGRNWDSEEEEKLHSAAPSGWGIGLFTNRVKARLGSTMSYYSDPVTTKLLPDENPDPNFRMPFTLVLSLENNLIHSEWTRQHGWRVAVRPGFNYFIRYLSQYFELVVFTSQPMAMAEPVLRKLDPYGVIQWPLFREATLYKNGAYIKDLSYLNRDLKRVIIMDTSADHVQHQPENAIILPPWKGDPNDQTLIQFIPFLEYLATMGIDDARDLLKSFEGKNIPVEFARREKLLREKFLEQQKEKQKGRPKRSIGLGSLFGKQKSQDGLPSSDEAIAEGKMIWDLIRERGQKGYMEFQKRIEEEGPKYLAEREAEEKRMQDEAYKNMTTGFFGGMFGGGDSGGEKK